MGLLSWWRGRGQDAAESPASTAPAVREAPAWPHMPPLQRTLATPPGVTIDPTGFQGSLTTRQDTALGTPLGHLVDPEAPSGLGHGIASASASTPPAVQRSIAFPGPPTGPTAPAAPTVALQRATPSTMVESTHIDAGPPLEVPYAPSPDGGFGPAPVGWSDAPQASVQSMQSVQSVQTARPVQEAAPEAATSPGDDARPTVSPEAPSGPTAQAMPVQRSRRSGGSADPHAHPHADAVPMTFRPGPHVGRMPLGFGAPLSELPPTAQRSAAARSGPEAPSPVPASTPTGAGMPDVPDAPDAPAAEPPSEALPVAPLLGDTPVPSSAGESATADPPGPSTAAAQRAVDMPVRTNPAKPAAGPRTVSLPPPMLPPASPLPVVPLVAQRSVPLYSGVELPGPAPSSVDRGAGRASPAAADVPAVVPVRWEASEPAAGPPVQRSAASVPAKARTGAVGTASTTRTATLGTVQRSTGPAAAPGSFTNAGDAAVASGVGRRAADGSVVFDHLMVQREEEGETGVEPEPPQAPVVFDPSDTTAAGDIPPPAEPPPEGPGTPGEPAGTPTQADDDGADPDSGPGRSEGGKPPVVTDELVRALYPPLSRMLRADLRLERERAGFLIDTRH
ncbi:hypothetical protein OG216_40020 [Streptomycetaceae bacterium NBC_01309]